MSEPIVERLSRFTPDAGRLDRDSLLYEAGRKSARPNRAWTVSTSSANSVTRAALGGSSAHATSAAVSLMAANREPQPLTMIMMGGPIDARRSPTAVNNLARRKPHGRTTAGAVVSGHARTGPAAAQRHSFRRQQAQAHGAEKTLATSAW